MARLQQNRSINLANGSTAIVLTELVDTYFLWGHASGPIVITATGTSLEGMLVTFKFTGDMHGYTLTILGDAIVYDDDTEFVSTCSYRNAAWNVNTVPDFETGGGVGSGQIIDGAITGDKIAAALDLTGVTITNIDINSGTVDNVAIGSGTPATSIITDALVATTADINGGTIDGTIIGASTPAAINATTIGASGAITGNLTGNVVGNLTGNVTGNAATSTKLAATKTIAGQAFDGSANIDITVENLTGTTLTTNDLNILTGAHGAVSNADLLAVAKINSTMSSDTDALTIKAGKMLDAVGYITQSIEAPTIGATVLNIDTAYVFAYPYGSSISVQAPDPALCAGKRIDLYNSGILNLTVATAGGNIVDYNGISLLASVNVKPSKSLAIVSDGVNWQSIKRTGGHYTTNNVTIGQKAIKIVQSATLKPALDTATNPIVKFDAGDIITNAKISVGAAAGAACSVSVGVDNILRSAGAVATGLLKVVNANTLGIYDSGDPALTFQGSLLTTGNFICDQTGYVTVIATTDQSASVFEGSLIIEYIPA